jgi:hypothetical protein
MKRAISIGTVGALLLLAIASTSAVETAAADTPGCVTKGEFRKVHRGFHKRRVHRIFDTAGKQTSWYSGFGTTYEGREYRACTSQYGVHGVVWVDYENRRLSAKYAAW